VRKYIKMDRTESPGEAFMSPAYAQCWTRTTIYTLNFPGVSIGAGRATRIVLVTGLNQVDRVNFDVNQNLSPAKDRDES